MLLVAWLIGGCNTDVQIAATPDPPAQTTQERLGLTDAESDLILDFLNDCAAKFDLLDSVVGLDSDAAANLVDHRNGPDGTCDTSDDEPYGTLDDVDAVPEVGDTTILEVLAYLVAGEDGTGEWEGISFSAAEQEVVLDIVNEATSSQLNDDVNLASDEAANVIDARPIDSMGDLAEIPQVGASAMQKLKDFVPRWGG